MSCRSLIKDWLPPRILKWARSFFGNSLRFSGQLHNWTEAREMSTGYDDNNILIRVAATTRQVLKGQAKYERDSVAFNEIDYSFPLVTSLLYAASMNNGRLDVIDFGGSLGSTYRQCKPFFGGLKNIKWQVIEQTNFVDMGRNEFSTEELTFHNTIGQLENIKGHKRILLLSSVLQYLESPLKILDEFKQLDLSHIIIDRTPISKSPDNSLCIQKVPKNIYDASYPCWILSEYKLLSNFSEHWDKFYEFPCLDGKWSTDDGLDFEYKGFLFVLKN